MSDQGNGRGRSAAAPGRNTFCPRCGFNVAIDDDGCCRTCGATAVGPAVEALVERMRAIRPEGWITPSSLTVLRWNRGRRATAVGVFRKEAAGLLPLYVGAPSS